MIKILDNLMAALELLNLGTYEDKEKNYFLTFNGSHPHIYVILIILIKVPFTFMIFANI